MARNRIIKPDFWADEKIGSLSLMARLLFIGMWNFADDTGVVRASSAYLRNNIFPYDDLNLKDIHGALSECCNKKFIVLSEYNNEKFALIKNFLKHQLINRPSKFRFISSDYKEIFKYSVSVSAVLSEGSLTNVDVEENVNDEVDVEDKFFCYGFYENVFLSEEQKQRLLCNDFIPQKQLEELIEDLSKNVAVKKELPFDGEQNHYAKLRTYWNFRKKNPDKFVNPTEVKKYAPLEI